MSFTSLVLSMQDRTDWAKVVDSQEFSTSTRFDRAQTPSILDLSTLSNDISSNISFTTLPHPSFTLLPNISGPLPNLSRTPILCLPNRTFLLRISLETSTSFLLLHPTHSPSYSFKPSQTRSPSFFLSSLQPLLDLPS